MQLPFLKNKQWPRTLKLTGESRYGFSEDDDLIEHALNDLVGAYEARDGAQLADALKALIRLIQTKEMPDGDAPVAS